MIEVLEKGTDLKQILAGIDTEPPTSYDGCGYNSCNSCGTKSNSEGKTNEETFNDQHWGWHHRSIV